MKQCPRCEGAGKYPIDNKGLYRQCNSCFGTGKLPDIAAIWAEMMKLKAIFQPSFGEAFLKGIDPGFGKLIPSSSIVETIRNADVFSHQEEPTPSKEPDWEKIGELMHLKSGGEIPWAELPSSQQIMYISCAKAAVAAYKQEVGE